MKLSVLIDNNTLIDRYFTGEPGLSYLIQDDNLQVLFDTGYSGAFITNAQKMNINLLQSNYIVLSHSHLDHTWGLDPLIRLYTEAKIESLPLINPVLVAHPDIFYSKSMEGIPELGSIISESKLRQHFGMKLSREPVWLNERLVFLGEIERSGSFENMEPIGKISVNKEIRDDFVLEDSALAYKGEQGLVVITGCSHAGICNIVEQARKVCKEEKIFDVIGGFHLLNPSAAQLSGTVEYFKKLKPQFMHPCHCVDLDSKIALSKAAEIKEVGVGLTLNYI